MSANDPVAALAREPMGSRQWLAVLILVGINALDGFDILSISFASTGLAQAWQVGSGKLGWVLTMELIGMAAGSLLLGGVADRVGRRRTMLGCLVVMTFGMYGAGRAGSLPVLMAYRVLTGLGIGGMLAAISAAMYETCNLRWRPVAMSALVVGYPLGGVLGGWLVQRFLNGSDWHAIFLLGAALTAAFALLVLLFVPESVLFLERSRPDKALDRINAILARFGHQKVTELPPVSAKSNLVPLADLFRSGLAAKTLLVTLAYFLHIMAFYFLSKWSPKIAADAFHLTPASAAGVVTWVSIGGVLGGLLFGFMASRIPIKTLTMLAFAGSGCTIAWFGRGAVDMPALIHVVTVAGFFTTAGIVGLYTLFARVFPTSLRASGMGFAIGVGRGGAVLGPVVAGYLFEAGFGLQHVALFMATGSAMAVVALRFLRLDDAV